MNSDSMLRIVVIVVPDTGYRRTAEAALRDAVSELRADPVLGECVHVHIAHRDLRRTTAPALLNQLVLAAAAVPGVVVGGLLLATKGPVGAGWDQVVDACQGAGMFIEVGEWIDGRSEPAPGSSKRSALRDAIIQFATKLAMRADRSPDLPVAASALPDLQKQHENLSNGGRTDPKRSLGASSWAGLRSMLRFGGPQTTPSLLERNSTSTTEANLRYLVLADGASSRASQDRWVQQRAGTLLEHWGRQQSQPSTYFSVVRAASSAQRLVSLVPLDSARAKMAPRPRNYGLDLGAVFHGLLRISDEDDAALDRRNICVVSRRIILISAEAPLADPYTLGHYEQLCAQAQVIWLVPATLRSLISAAFGAPHGIITVDHHDIIEELDALIGQSPTAKTADPVAVRALIPPDDNSSGR